MQFLPLPTELKDAEKGALAQAFRLPLGAFCARDWAYLHEWNAPRVRPLEVLSIASLARTAKSTLPEYGRIYRWLARMTDTPMSQELDACRLT
eukprot:8331357-Pyramimonas_sp.AAC.1